MCRAICKNGRPCPSAPAIDGLCMTHYCMENGIELHSNIRKTEDNIIKLWRD
jgi:hypothetical protein